MNDRRADDASPSSGTRRKRRLRLQLVPVAAALALLLAACGGNDESADEGAGDTTTSGGEAVTVDWWHIQNSDPGLSLWKAVADEYMADHPNVTIKITVQENEAFKKALQTNLQAGDVPDIFQSWGGGGLRDQVDAGLVKDVTDEVESWDHELNGAAASMMEIEDKMYGVPFDLGIVGVWYNKALFEQAGIDAPPETWAELLDDVEKLKDAGITPISLAAGDKWPGMFWYGYLALRVAGADVMQKAGIDENFDDPAFIRAGEEIERLVALKPFQSGFLATPWDGPDGAAGVISNGKAAMLLMGHWAPGTMEANGPGLGENLGWFPFPTVEDGAGDPKDAFGGGNGFAVGKDAAARGDRVPGVPLEPRGREAGWQRGEPPPDDRRLGGLDHRPEPRRRDRIAWRGGLRAAVPRPGVPAGSRRGGQRLDRDAVRRTRHAAERR